MKTKDSTRWWTLAMATSDTFMLIIDATAVTIVGVAVGIAGFGALFHHRVVDAFLISPAAAKLGPHAGELAQAAAAGAPTTGLDAGAAQAAAEALRIALVHGFTNAMVLCAIVCRVGAPIAFLFIRRSDLHASALSTPDTDAEAALVPAAADVPS